MYATPFIMLGTFVAIDAWLLLLVRTQVAFVVAPLVASLAIMAYLGGPAAFIAVTERYVVVANPLVKYTVPRQLVDGVQGHRRLNVELRVSGHSPIDIRALIPGLTGGNSLRLSTYNKKLKSVLQLLDETPPSTVAGPVEREYRRAHVLLALVAFAASSIALAFVAIGPV